MSYHTGAVVCNAIHVYHLGLTSPVSLRGIISPKASLIFLLAMVKKIIHLIGFPGLSEDSQNRTLIKKSSQVPMDKI